MRNADSSHSTRHIAGTATLAGRLVRIASGLASGVRQRLAAYRSRQGERATRLALAGLDARTLRDIGLDRSEIPSVARELQAPLATRIHALRAGREGI